MKALALSFLVAAAAFGEPIEVAAAKADITPDPKRELVWLAGYGTGRRATGIHDPIWARAVAFRSGTTTIVIVALDLVGYFRPEVEKIRSILPKKLGVTHLVICSTHNHEGPDTMGLWGPLPFVSGVRRDYMTRVRTTTIRLIEKVVGNLRPALLRMAETTAPVEGVVGDHRDPVIFDDTLSVMSIEDAADGAPITTLVNWACHPETLGSRNTELTSDYPHYLREAVEAELGGVCVFLSGALGGMMTPEPPPGLSGFEAARHVGESIGRAAVRALEGARAVKEAPITVRTMTFDVPVENKMYRLGMLIGNLKRDVYDEDGNLFDGSVLRKATVAVRTEVSMFRIGEAQFITVPGELLPELAVGGYDGSRSHGKEIIAKDNPNPPDLTKAPKGPYLRDLMNGKVKFLLGLANDELGYIIPPYDFQRNDKSPIHQPEPAGDHYEETNSLGIEAAPRIVGALEKLLSE